MIAEDGRIYEREAIEQWFKSQANHGGVKSPVTNVAMGASLVEAKQVHIYCHMWSILSLCNRNKTKIKHFKHILNKLLQKNNNTNMYI